MCYVYNQWYDISCAILYVTFLRTAHSYDLKMEAVVSSETLVCITFHPTFYTE